MKANLTNFFRAMLIVEIMLVSLLAIGGMQIDWSKFPVYVSEVQLCRQYFVSSNPERDNVYFEAKRYRFTSDDSFEGNGVTLVGGVNEADKEWMYICRIQDGIVISSEPANLIDALHYMAKVGKLIE